MPKKTNLPKLSEAQTEIMNVVWEHGEASVARVMEELNTRRKVSRNTVQTMLSRLAKKGWLRHRQEGNTFFYEATVGKRETLSAMAENLVNTAFSGSAERLVMALLDGRGISTEERSRIQEMIKKAHANNSRKQ